MWEDLVLKYSVERSIPILLDDEPVATAYVIRDIRTTLTFDVIRNQHGWRCSCDNGTCGHIQRAVLYKHNLKEMQAKVSSTEAVVLRSELKRKIRLK